MLHVKHQKRNDFTARIFEQVGISKGMRVLDVGCATGEVSRLVSEIVGETGEVVGIDTSGQMIEMAQQNNPGSNITYLQQDIYDLPEDLGKFDAIVGRRVLMYLPDPQRALQLLIQHLKPNGIIAFQESDAINCGVGGDRLPHHQEAIQRVWKTVQAEGGDIHICQKLYDIFLRLGIESPHIEAEAVMQTAENNDLQWLTEIMIERMRAHHIVDDDFTLDQFKQEMTEEAEENKAAFIRDMNFGIWGHGLFL
ncbi:methyltransferase domain-containing protein [Staphylococcus pettenkoferi]|uniref:class I SAM-dependent methyltransferase n=1 Tax=Staphylococcus pettenkoferi TaxID=170573 RepID=UPI001C8B20B4|nr:methyltransferase domain-containing protein [Staphylococcus pettenkoferi]MBX8993103.1 methyltransferase domain-containing protein [Staphylococcus pettenkoferi]